jgi:hypothetical protein
MARGALTPIIGLHLLALAARLRHNAEIGQPGLCFSAYGHKFGINHLADIPSADARAAPRGRCARPDRRCGTRRRRSVAGVPPRGDVQRRHLPPLRGGNRSSDAARRGRDLLRACRRRVWATEAGLLPESCPPDLRNSTTRGVATANAREDEHGCRPTPAARRLRGLRRG